MKYLKLFCEAKNSDIKTFIEEVLINLIDNGVRVYTKVGTISTDIDIQFGKRTKWIDVKDDVIRLLILIQAWGIHHIYISLVNQVIVVNNNGGKNIQNLIDENWEPNQYFSSINIVVRNPSII